MTRSAVDANKVHAAVREVGGIVHSDGNIFFTNAEKLLAALSLLREAELALGDVQVDARAEPSLPACEKCGGTGEIIDGGTAWVCKCWGTGVQMNENEPYKGQSGWNLHRCPDDADCRSGYPGGCATGYCAHFKVASENLYPNIRAAMSSTPNPEQPNVHRALLSRTARNGDEQ